MAQDLSEVTELGIWEGLANDMVEAEQLAVEQYWTQRLTAFGFRCWTLACEVKEPA